MGFFEKVKKFKLENKIPVTFKCLHPDNNHLDLMATLLFDSLHQGNEYVKFKQKYFDSDSYF